MLHNTFSAYTASDTLDASVGESMAVVSNGINKGGKFSGRNSFGGTEAESLERMGRTSEGHEDTRAGM
jgi:hypothetical protein